MLRNGYKMGKFMAGNHHLRSSPRSFYEGDTITQHTNRGFATSSQILPLFWIKVFLMASITSRTNQLTSVEQPSRYVQYSMQGKYFIPMPHYQGTWPMPCLVHLSNSLVGCHDSNGGNSNARFERISWSILIHQNPNVIPSIFIPHLPGEGC